MSCGGAYMLIKNKKKVAELKMKNRGGEILKKAMKKTKISRKRTFETIKKLGHTPWKRSTQNVTF
jgi:hypothetical protein